MALEAVVFQHEPFTCSLSKELSPLSTGEIDRWNFEFQFSLQKNSIWDVHSPSADGLKATAPHNSRKKRRRLKRCKNKEEAENQRMTHIAVERNRRRQMNEYLAVLRSIMPESYVHKSDQASIIGGAISYVKELEHLLQTLEARKKISRQLGFPCSQVYTAGGSSDKVKEELAADIEVTMVESHASLKLLSKRRPGQLLKMVIGLQNLRLTTLHLNVTTIDQMVLYSFSLKVEEDCMLASVEELAKAVYQMMGRIEVDAAGFQ